MFPSRSISKRFVHPVWLISYDIMSFFCTISANGFDSPNILAECQRQQSDSEHDDSC